MMFCKKCGAQLNDGASFCKNCGTPVSRPVQQSQPEVKVQPRVTPQPTVAPQSEVKVQPRVTPQPTVAPQPEVKVQPKVEPQPTVTPQPRVQPQPTVQVQPRPVQPVQATPQAPQKSSTGKTIAIILGILALIAAIICGIFAANGGSSNKKRDREDEIVEDEVDSTAAEDAVRTLMIYIVGSNLESGPYGGAASRDIKEMLKADIPDNCNVVLQCGGAKEWENKDIPDGEVTIFTIRDGKLNKEKSLGKTTMTQEGDLSEFIKYSKENFPAENYSLILWDHGGGIPIGFGMDELSNDPEDFIYDYEIRDELDKAGVDFDAVIFDACNMCTLEMGLCLKDHAKYMVGAESYVNNKGIYYTDWLGMLDGDAQAFSEKIVQDYMADISSDGLVGSMSVIRLDYITDVYDAYINYVGDIADNVENGGFAAYAKARGNCGSFEGIDSVDLIALATAYDTDNASTLINSAVNAVSYTESDFAYGHGLMVYCPFEIVEAYDIGREAFVELNYDNEITDFYDKFVSAELSLMGQSYVSSYGGDWYTTAYADHVSSSGGVSSNSIGLVETDDYYAVELSDSDWEVIDHVALTVAVESDGEYLILGQDYTYQTDSQGRLALVDPEAWTFVNGNIASYYCVDYYSDPESEEWSQMGYIPCTINGEGALLYVYYDDKHPEGTIQGYTTYDFDTEEEGAYLYDLRSDDEIDLVFYVLSDAGDTYYTTMDEPFLASELELSYSSIDLNEYTTLGYYTIYDVYGNEYETDATYLGSTDAV
ncbi:MAG: zinc-ribbon domain-containing protein [Pseudobutyrivibrio sp.]|nr:zinc-ribbon domain-containing protein [Pseudobutyrivibrio sp.]